MESVPLLQQLRHLIQNTEKDILDESCSFLKQIHENAPHDMFDWQQSEFDDFCISTKDLLADGDWENVIAMVLETRLMCSSSLLSTSHIISYSPANPYLTYMLIMHDIEESSSPMCRKRVFDFFCSIIRPSMTSYGSSDKSDLISLSAVPHFLNYCSSEPYSSSFLDEIYSGMVCGAKKIINEVDFNILCSLFSSFGIYPTLTPITMECIEFLLKYQNTDSISCVISAIGVYNTLYTSVGSIIACSTGVKIIPCLYRLMISTPDCCCEVSVLQFLKKIVESIKTSDMTSELIEILAHFACTTDKTDCYELIQLTLSTFSNRFIEKQNVTPVINFERNLFFSLKKFTDLLFEKITVFPDPSVTFCQKRNKITFSEQSGDAGKHRDLDRVCKTIILTEGKGLLFEKCSIDLVQKVKSLFEKMVHIHGIFLSVLAVFKDISEDFYYLIEMCIFSFTRAYAAVCRFDLWSVHFGVGGGYLHKYYSAAIDFRKTKLSESVILPMEKAFTSAFFSESIENNLTLSFLDSIVECVNLIPFAVSNIVEGLCGYLKYQNKNFSFLLVRLLGYFPAEHIHYVTNICLRSWKDNLYNRLWYRIMRYLSCINEQEYDNHILFDWLCDGCWMPVGDYGLFSRLIKGDSVRKEELLKRVAKNGDESSKAIVNKYTQNVSESLYEEVVLALMQIPKGYRSVISRLDFHQLNVDSIARILYLCPDCYDSIDIDPETLYVATIKSIIHGQRQLVTRLSNSVQDPLKTFSSLISQSTEFERPPAVVYGASLFSSIERNVFEMIMWALSEITIIHFDLFVAGIEIIVREYKTEYRIFNQGVTELRLLLMIKLLDKGFSIRIPNISNFPYCISSSLTGNKSHITELIKGLTSPSKLLYTATLIHCDYEMSDQNVENILFILSESLLSDVPSIKQLAIISAEKLSAGYYKVIKSHFLSGKGDFSVLSYFPCVLTDEFKMDLWNNMAAKLIVTPLILPFFDQFDLKYCQRSSISSGINRIIEMIHASDTRNLAIISNIFRKNMNEILESHFFDESAKLALFSVQNVLTIKNETARLFLHYVDSLTSHELVSHKVITSFANLIYFQKLDLNMTKPYIVKIISLCTQLSRDIESIMHAITLLLMCGVDFSKASEVTLLKPTFYDMRPAFDWVREALKRSIIRSNANFINIIRILPQTAEYLFPLMDHRIIVNEFPELIFEYYPLSFPMPDIYDEAICYLRYPLASKRQRAINILEQLKDRDMKMPLRILLMSQKRLSLPPFLSSELDRTTFFVTFDDRIRMVIDMQLENCQVNDKFLPYNIFIVLTETARLSLLYHEESKAIDILIFISQFSPCVTSAMESVAYLALLDRFSKVQCNKVHLPPSMASLVNADNFPSDLLVNAVMSGDVVFALEIAARRKKSCEKLRHILPYSLMDNYLRYPASYKHHLCYFLNDTQTMRHFAPVVASTILDASRKKESSKVFDLILVVSQTHAFSKVLRVIMKCLLPSMIYPLLYVFHSINELKEDLLNAFIESAEKDREIAKELIKNSKILMDSCYPIPPVIIHSIRRFILISERYGIEVPLRVTKVMEICEDQIIDKWDDRNFLETAAEQLGFPELYQYLHSIPLLAKHVELTADTMKSLREAAFDGGIMSRELLNLKTAIVSTTKKGSRELNDSVIIPAALSCFIDEDCRHNGIHICSVETIKKLIEQQAIQKNYKYLALFVSILDPRLSHQLSLSQLQYLPNYSEAEQGILVIGLVNSFLQGGSLQNIEFKHRHFFRPFIPFITLISQTRGFIPGIVFNDSRSLCALSIQNQYIVHDYLSKGDIHASATITMLKQLGKIGKLADFMFSIQNGKPAYTHIASNSETLHLMLILVNASLRIEIADNLFLTGIGPDITTFEDGFLINGRFSDSKEIDMFVQKSVKIDLPLQMLLETLGKMLGLIVPFTLSLREGYQVHVFPCRVTTHIYDSDMTIGNLFAYLIGDVSLGFEPRFYSVAGKVPAVYPGDFTRECHKVTFSVKTARAIIKPHLFKVMNYMRFYLIARDISTDEKLYQLFSFL